MLTGGMGGRLHSAEEALDPVVAVGELAGVGAVGRSVGLGHAPPPPIDHSGDAAWDLRANQPGVVFGVVALLLSEVFDGHTVSKGNRILTGVVDVVHVAGGAVWAGGLTVLAATMWRRHRQGRELRALQLAARFSIVAGAALVVVGAAGIVLTVIVLDSPSGLWSTPWGRLLMAKVATVLVAGSVGAYNHTVLMPELFAKPDSPELDRWFKGVVTGEAVALALVLLLTSFLVVAAS